MISGLNHITLAVIDIERSFLFYRDMMGFKPLCKWKKGAYFLAGDLWFCLNHDVKRQPVNDYTHYAFTVANTDFETMKIRLLDSGIEEFQINKSPGQSFYFLDPDGHKLELHSSSWQERLASMCGNNDISFFDQDAT